MYQELHRWDECIAVAEAKVLFLSSHHNCSELGLANSRNLSKEAMGSGMGLGLADMVQN